MDCSSRLFLQYIVDQLWNVETERLKCARKNKWALRAADYITIQEGLADIRNTENKLDIVRAMRQFVVPFTYVSGGSYMWQ